MIPKRSGSISKTTVIAHVIKISIIVTHACHLNFGETYTGRLQVQPCLDNLKRPCFNIKSAKGLGMLLSGRALRQHVSKRPRFSSSVLVERLDTKLGSILDQWKKLNYYQLA